MYDSADDMTHKFLHPLMRVWEERINAAKRSKERFNAIAKTCNDFYESQQGFMWQDRQFFNGALPSPKFQICVAKAYEFVSIFGPSLFWDYANRKVIGQRQLKLKPEMFGDPRDQQAQQMGAQVRFQEAQERAVQEFANEVMSIYLNWSQREQPGTLITHGNQAVTESLIKGMGTLWPETYSQPGSEARYTRLTYDTVDNLYIDPDCRDPLWETAGYIMCRHVNPTWQVERMFGLERGALDGKGTVESGEMRARRGASHATKSDAGKTFDCIEWYEIWSKVGVGPRTNVLNHSLIDYFDDAVGDHAYLCVAPGVEYPLNAHPDRFFGDAAADTEAVREMFQWRCKNFGDPFPVYMDGRWPVAKLSYNPLMGSPWPLAPLAPGLGELVAINVLTSSFIDASWNNRQQILAYLKSAASEVEDVLNSDDAVVKVGLNDNIHSSINEVVQFLQKPPAQTDQLAALEMLSGNFNRRVGLNELQYGESRTQVRVASDGRAKQEALAIRPQKMAKDVARWLTDASQQEMFLAAMHVQGRDLVHLLGQFGAERWDALFGNVDLEKLMREARASIEASEVARPNRDRDTANIQSLQQYVLPILQAFAQQTSDTTPLNKFMEMVTEAMDFNDNPVELPAWKPPTDPEAAKIQQMQNQIEIEAKQADVANKQAQSQKHMASAQKTMVDAQAAMMNNTMPGGLVDELHHEQEIRQRDEVHEQELLHKEQSHVQQLLFSDADAAFTGTKKEERQTDGQVD